MEFDWLNIRGFYTQLHSKATAKAAVTLSNSWQAPLPESHSTRIQTAVSDFVSAPHSES